MTNYVLVCVDESLPTSTCAVTEWVEYSTTLSIEELDLEIFAQVDGYLLIAFFTGHALGRLIKWLKK